jgi:DNA-directed RNA polymerase subunit RPC12/RpoP
MATLKMREVEEGEVPYGAGTAVQEDPDRPAFNGAAEDDYVCVKCGNLLAHGMHQLQMNEKLRIKCAVCGTVNVAVQVEFEGPPPRMPAWPGPAGKG